MDATQQVVCPRCGSADQVYTLQQLFDLLNTMQDAVMRQGGNLPRKLPEPRPLREGDWIDVDHNYSYFPGGSQDLANDVLGTASRLIGRVIGKRLRKGVEKNILANMDAVREQATSDLEQGRRDQAAIAAGHPDLRGCLADQVLFRVGGTAVIPLADIPMPVTAAQADALASRL